MSTINYTYNVIVDRFRQFAAGHFQLRRFTHGEISQADLEKEAEWPWLHVKPRAINYSPGTRSFQFEIFISDLPRDKEDKTGYQAESITDCSLIFQDLINEIYLGNMFGTDAVLTRPVNSEPFVEQYTHTLTGVTGTIELQLDYDWSACSIPASWNYNTPTDSGSDGWGALQFIESLDQNGVFVSLDGDVEAPGNSYYYGTNSSGVKGWYQLIDQVGITCEDLPECATIISIVDDIAALQTDVTALQTDVTDLETNKVPYTGATGNVNLGEFELKAGQLSLDTSPTGTASVGTTRWNDTIGSSETTLKGGSVILKNGVDLVARVVNKVTPNTTLTKAAYQAVRISGAQGQRLAVALAQANNDTNSADTIGVVTETIATNQEGFIMTVGNLEEINTTGSLQGETWADGDVLYLSPTTAGAITNVKPTGATGHIVVIGYVEYAHAIHGKIYVKVMNGWELDELHNVYIDTPVNNNVLTYESSTSLWKNKTVATALGYTPVPETRTLTINGTTQDLSANRTFTIATGLTVGSTAIASGTVGRVLFEGTGNVLQESANFFWDNTNSRLGIGTASPATRLHIVGDAMRVQNSIADATTKSFDLIQGHYTNSQPAFSLFTTLSNSSQNILWIGGGSGSYNSATDIRFFTGASNTTLTGTERMRINVNGNLLVGTTTDAGFKLDVNGSARIGGASGSAAFYLKGLSGTGQYLYFDNGSVANGIWTMVGSTVFAFDSATTRIWRISPSAQMTINGNTNLASAQFQVDSTTRGFLPPRMTNAQRLAIATPAVGLIVYCTDAVEGLYVNKSTGWTFVI
jgi:nitrogen fixation protein